jgi:hypothetical protein
MAWSRTIVIAASSGSYQTSLRFYRRSLTQSNPEQSSRAIMDIQKLEGKSPVLVERAARYRSLRMGLLRGSEVPKWSGPSQGE